MNKVNFKKLYEYLFHDTRIYNIKDITFIYKYI